MMMIMMKMMMIMMMMLVTAASQFYAKYYQHSGSATPAKVISLPAYFKYHLDLNQNFDLI